MCSPIFDRARAVLDLPASERAAVILDGGRIALHPIVTAADQPGSDAYMTSLAIVLMRQSGVPASDPRIQRGLAWLKREQRESGRWWMQSLYRGNYHYITYIATVEAMKALDLCGEISAIAAN